MDGRTDGRKDGHLEIHPCVLQDIGPLGPLPKKGCPRLSLLIFNHFLCKNSKSPGKSPNIPREKPQCSWEKPQYPRYGINKVGKWRNLVSTGDSLRDIPHLIPESFLAQTFKGGYNSGILNYFL